MRAAPATRVSPPQGKRAQTLLCTNSLADVEFVGDAGLDWVHLADEVVDEGFHGDRRFDTRLVEGVALAFEQLLEETFLARVAFDVHGFRRRNIRQLLGDFDGFVEAAEFVDEADLFRLRAGPDAALADFVHGFDGHLAAGCDALREIRVGFVERFLDVGALRGREILLLGKKRGVVAGGDRIGADAEQVVEARNVDLADDHADGAGDRVWIGDDFARVRGNPVAAGRGDV